MASLTSVPLTWIRPERSSGTSWRVKEPPAPVSIEKIQEVVARHYHLGPSRHEIQAPHRRDRFPRGKSHVSGADADRNVHNADRRSSAGKTYHGHACTNQSESRLDTDPFFAALVNKIIRKSARACLPAGRGKACISFEKRGQPRTLWALGISRDGYSEEAPLHDLI